MVIFGIILWFIAGMSSAYHWSMNLAAKSNHNFNWVHSAMYIAIVIAWPLMTMPLWVNYWSEFLKNITNLLRLK
jgi:hypothetical protein